MSTKFCSKPLAALALFGLLCGCSESTPPQKDGAAPASAGLTDVKMYIDADAMIPRLADGLGYFEEEGLRLQEVNILDLVPKDFMVQEPLIRDDIQVAYHWFQHAAFGARNNLPVKAVMSISDAPGMTVMVADRVKDEIESARDFKGRNVAEGAAYATKSMLVNYLTHREGLPPRSYNAVVRETAGRDEKVIAGLENGGVDVVAFMEPQVARYRATGVVSTLYDLTTREATTKVLGATLPAESLLMAPEFIEGNPDLAQRIVDVFVKTMRYVNSHSAEDIVAHLPQRYLDGKDQAAETARIASVLQTYAQGDYSFKEADVALLLDTIETFPFDDSPAGIWRRTAHDQDVQPQDLYTNWFVDRAMQRIK